MRSLPVLVLVSVLAVPVRGQSSAEANAGVQFNFGSPGARSLGLGGAFVGIADDATAVFINPAGLTQMVKMEVALEGRVSSYTNTFTQRGRTFGEPTMTGMDDVLGLVDGTQTESAIGLSFASLVYPGRRCSAALYRHELADFYLSTRAEGVILEETTRLGPKTVRTFPSTNELDLNITTFGASFAYSIVERLSLGVTLAHHQLNLDSTTNRYEYDSARLTDHADFRQIVAVDEQHGHGSELALQAGLLWRATDRVTVGASYQQASEFDVDVRTHAPDDEGTPIPGAKFNIPAIYRIGASMRLGSGTMVSVELDRIRYSQLGGDFVPLHAEPPLYGVDDGTEVHLGVQQFLSSERLLDVTRYPIVLTAGVWRDPDHRIRYEGDTTAQRFLFRAGDDAYHFSLGAALAAGESYEIGVAYDHSSRRRTASVSLILRY
jgi:long-chain fatty acid transport protein